MSAGSTKIVVGVDGSLSSRAALRWAVRQAVVTDGTVKAVTAWHVPVSPYGYTWAPIFVDEADHLEEDARKVLDAAISEEVGPADRQRVTARVINGHPAEVLLKAAAGADLLVVGSRGHGAFADALLGSVGQYCVHHAHCPVLVMRGEPQRAAAGVRAAVRRG
jgi:nucleotide-binding universal stress UspA family protein